MRFLFTGASFFLPRKKRVEYVFVCVYNLAKICNNCTIEILSSIGVAVRKVGRVSRRRPSRRQTAPRKNAERDFALRINPRGELPARRHVPGKRASCIETQMRRLCTQRRATCGPPHCATRGWNTCPRTNNAFYLPPLFFSLLSTFPEN